jgi:hypothetical protein
MRQREQPRETRRIIEAVIAAMVDPGGDPAEAESVKAEIVWQIPDP